MIRRSIGTPTARTQLRRNIRFNASSFCPGLFAHAEPSGRKLVAPRSEMPSAELRGPGYAGPIFKGPVFMLASYIDATKVLYSNPSCEHSCECPTLCCIVMIVVIVFRSKYHRLRRTSILCLYYLDVIKGRALSPRENLLFYFAHNCAIVAEINSATGSFLFQTVAVKLSA